MLRSSSRSSSSSSHGNGPSTQHPSRTQPSLTRHFSDERPSWRMPYERGDLPESFAYASPTSPSRSPLQRSSRSQPSVPRSSAPQTHAASRSSIDGDKQLQAPHDVVLRSRLEGVLKGANHQVDRRSSRERGSGHESGSSNSIASSRNMSVEGDWFCATGEVRYFCDSYISHSSEIPPNVHSSKPSRALPQAWTPQPS